MTRRQALDCRPIKNAEVRASRLDSGTVLLTYPIRIRPWIASLERLLKGSAGLNRSGKLQLDTLGTVVWDLMDGKRSVRDIVDHFALQQHLQPREAEIAVTRFLRELGRRGLIGIG